MKRRDFLHTSAAIGLSTAIAGCNTLSSDQSTPSDSATKTIEKNGQLYYFQDETGTLGHIGTENPPEDVEDWQVIENTLEEDEWREKQENDIQFTEEALKDGTMPNAQGLNTTVNDIIQDTQEIYRNPLQHLQTELTQTLGRNLDQEDNEITFTRALVRATQNAGTDSSGLADDIVSNLAEHALTQIPETSFNNYKLTTVNTGEALDPSSSGFVSEARTVEETGQEWGNSGFRHLAAILQYQKNGETHVKYVEQTDATNQGSFKYVVRNPEDSLYHASLDQDRVTTMPLDEIDAETPAEAGTGNIRFPENYVSPLAYRKARELESLDMLGLGNEEKLEENENYTAVGDYFIEAIDGLVDDVGIQGYGKNPDVDLKEQRPGIGGRVVSHEFGDSVEQYMENPDPETRQQLENISRGLYQLRQQTSQGWQTPLAITGTIQNPEIRATTQETVNQIRVDQAYDQVKQRVTG